MKAKRVSLDDIAKALGVSKATVSVVLNGRGDEFNISKKKQVLIHEKAKELQYVPNFFAKSLRQGETKTIGLVLADISNPFYAEMCKIIQETLYSKGYKTFIVNTNDDKELEKTLMRELIQRSIDGMIISPCNTIDALIPILHETHIPVVFSDRPGDENADFVGIDNMKEASLLIGKFKNTPKKILAISQHDASIQTISERLQGLNEASKKSGIELMHINLSSDRKEALAQVKNELSNHVDAIISLNNMVALVTLGILQELKINVPNDVKLISFDDHEVFSFMTPSVTALRQPVNKIAAFSVERMMERLQESEVPGKHQLLECEFIERGSH
jgi:LacI family transcriptional regulator